MNFLRALSTVSGMTLLSRITGLARESLKAVLFAEGAFSQAFVPILAEYRRQRGSEETRALVGRVATALALALLVVSVLGILAAPWLVYLLAAGFERTPGKVELTTELIRVVFPYILFVSLVSLAGGVLNVHRRFAIPAFTPVLLNVAMIASAIVLAPHVDPPVMALAWGVALGGVLQLALQLRPLAKLGMLPRPRFDWGDPGIRRVLVAMGPAILGVSAAQISALINTQLAAWLGDGRISWITYADRLMEFPSALLGVALGTVLLPALAQHHSDADPARYSDLLDWGLRLALLLALPAALALWLLAVPLIATLYQYGRFTDADVWAVRHALLGYAVGLPALVLVKILAPGFYAQQNLKTPVKIAFVTVLASLALALVLMWPLGHGGLTLATSLGACINAALLFTFLYRRGIYRPRAGWPAFVGKLIVALAVLGAVLLAVSGSNAGWIGASLGARASHLALVVAAGGFAYFATLWVLGFRLADFNRRDETGRRPADVDPLDGG